jgi:hypothetical protein
VVILALRRLVDLQRGKKERGAVMEVGNMWRAFFAGLLLFSSLAFSAGRAPTTSADGSPIGDRVVLVVFFAGEHNRPARGETVPLSRAFMILYIDVPCRLPIEDAKNMFRMVDMTGPGCWGPTYHDGFEIVRERETGIDRRGGLAETFEIAIFHVASKTLSVKEENAQRFVDALSSGSTKSSADCLLSCP